MRAHIYSRYRETNRYGDCREWENGVDLEGSVDEIGTFVERYGHTLQLPGINVPLMTFDVQHRLLEDLNGIRKKNKYLIGE